MTPKMKAMLDEELRQMAHRLFLTHSVLEACLKEATPKQEEFLLHVLKQEMASREESKRHRLTKRAGFPVYKSSPGKSLKAASSWERARISSCMVRLAPERPIWPLLPA